MCSRAQAARPLAGTAAPATAISSRLRHAGNSRGCALLATPEPADPAFRADVLNGLSEAIPAIPARWLYDRRGSELFDAITRLPSYYPTRTETALLTRIMPEIDALSADNCAVVELGSGSSTKTPLLLRGIEPEAYVPV